MRLHSEVDTILILITQSQRPPSPSNKPHLQGLVQIHLATKFKPRLLKTSQRPSFSKIPLRKELQPIHLLSVALLALSLVVLVKPALPIKQHPSLMVCSIPMLRSSQIQQISSALLAHSELVEEITMRLQPLMTPCVNLAIAKALATSKKHTLKMISMMNHLDNLSYTLASLSQRNRTRSS